MEKKKRETHSLIISLADLIQDESKEKIVGAGRASYSHTVAWLIPSTRRGWWKKRWWQSRMAPFSRLSALLFPGVLPLQPLLPLPSPKGRKRLSSPLSPKTITPSISCAKFQLNRCTMWIIPGFLDGRVKNPNREREFSKDPKDEQREYHGVRIPLAPFFVRERSFRVDGDGGRERIIHGRVRQRPRLAASNLATRLIGFRPIRKVHGESRPRPTPLSLPAVILAAAIYIN